MDAADFEDEVGYWQATVAHDRQGCLSIAEGMIRDGRGIDLLAVIGGTQRRIGIEWMSARWSVGQEHVATAINDAVLGLLEGSLANPSTEGTVAILCVEDEWHSMAARLLSIGLRFKGWETVFFGASLPTDHLEHFATSEHLTSVAVSCTMPTNLFRVRELAERFAGISAPILGGGIGFGPDGRWSVAAGVDDYAPSIETAAAVLSQWTPGVDRCGGPTRPVPDHLLRFERSELVDAAMVVLEARVPAVADFDDRRRRHTIADFGHIVDHLDAAMLTDDDTLFFDFIDWLLRVLEVRHVPPPVVRQSLISLAEAIRDRPEPMSLVQSSIERIQV